ncbi:MAG: hypothetical protein RBU25_12855, partial [Lentisphaeria bacterium]|nr:hypothetical protein [Lentisphaeria bacterium]
MKTSTSPANATPRTAANHLLALAGLLACLCPAICDADSTFWSGQEVTNVQVTLSPGDGERLLVLPDDPPMVLTFVASGSSESVGEPEEDAVEKPIEESSSWGVGNADIVGGGGADDNYVTIR